MPIRLDKEEVIAKVSVDVVTVLHIVSGVVLPLLADAMTDSKVHINRISLLPSPPVK